MLFHTFPPRLRYPLLFWVLLPLLLLLASCRDTASIRPLKAEPRLVVHAFPTVGDTLDIRVSLTRPINGSMPRLDVRQVRCLVNGRPAEVSLLRQDSVQGFPVHTYRVVSPLNVGDEVSLTVQAQGLPTASASTLIPRLTPLTRLQKDTIYRRERRFHRLGVTFPDREQPDYYAVRVAGREMRVLKYYDYEGDGELHYDTTFISQGFQDVETTLEPMLNNGTTGDGVFADDDRSFYGQMYVFNDIYATSRQPTIHLYMSALRADQYQVHFYTLSPEYYRMLRSLNDDSNNDLGEYGFAFKGTTYTNVQGGFGCVAGYTLSLSGWH